MKSIVSLTGLTVFMIGGSVVADSKPGYDRNSGLPFASRSEVIAQHGMAATSHPLTTQIALDVLKAGGNAIDAAIAANAALGLMEPTGNGLGGDLFAIIWDAEKKELVGLNASGRAPAFPVLSMAGLNCMAVLAVCRSRNCSSQQFAMLGRDFRSLRRSLACSS
jgi:hypothetical protein